MTQVRNTSRDLRIDPDSVGGGYFEHAVYDHIITSSDAEISDVEELVALDDESAAAD